MTRCLEWVCWAPNSAIRFAEVDSCSRNRGGPVSRRLLHVTVRRSRSLRLAIVLTAFLPAAAVSAIADEDEPLVTDRPDTTESTVTVSRGTVQIEVGLNLNLAAIEPTQQALLHATAGEMLAFTGLGWRVAAARHVIHAVATRRVEAIGDAAPRRAPPARRTNAVIVQLFDRPDMIAKQRAVFVGDWLAWSHRDVGSCAMGLDAQ